MDSEPILITPALSPDIDRILFLCDCKKDSSVYSYMREEAIRVAGEVSAAAVPIASLCFAEGSVFCVMTVGQKASTMSGGYFDQGEYVCGLIADAVCDDLIIQLGGFVKEELRLQCEKRGVGICRRMEAPQDMPMERQKAICHYAQAEKIGVHLLESLMLAPVKSTCCEYILSDKNEFHAEHDCSRCPRLDCKLRNRGSEQ